MCTKARTSATAAIPIEPPVNTVPGTVLLLPEGVESEIAGLSVVDSHAQTMTTMLQVQNGTLTVGTVDGASVSGSGTQEVTVGTGPSAESASLIVIGEFTYIKGNAGAPSFQLELLSTGSLKMKLSKWRTT